MIYIDVHKWLFVQNFSDPYQYITVAVTSSLNGFEEETAGVTYCTQKYGSSEAAYDCPNLFNTTYLIIDYKGQKYDNTSRPICIKDIFLYWLVQL